MDGAKVGEVVPELLQGDGACPRVRLHPLVHAGHRLLGGLPVLDEELHDGRADEGPQDRGLVTGQFRQTGGEAELLQGVLVRLPVGMDQRLQVVGLNDGPDEPGGQRQQGHVVQMVLAVHHIAQIDVEQGRDHLQVGEHLCVRPHHLPAIRGVETAYCQLELRLELLELDVGVAKGVLQVTRVGQTVDLVQVLSEVGEGSQVGHYGVECLDVAPPYVLAPKVPHEGLPVGILLLALHHHGGASRFGARNGCWARLGGRYLLEQVVHQPCQLVLYVVQVRSGEHILHLSMADLLVQMADPFPVLALELPR